MIEITPRLSADLLIAAATSFVGLGEERGTRGRGRMIEQFLTETRVPRRERSTIPWHTAFVHHVGYWSHYDHASAESRWPMPPLPSASTLGAFARLYDVLRKQPERGDVFLLWAPGRKRFERAGIIVRVENSGEWISGTAFHECETIEGNANERHAIGRRVLRLRRKFTPGRGDRFVRWTALRPHVARVAVPDDGMVAIPAARAA